MGNGGDIPELLLPYPGLQGGRQGHWGNTNERRFSAVCDRTEEPEYRRLMARRGGHFISVKTGEGHGPRAVVLMEEGGQAMRQVILDAYLTTPLHAFGLHVDRFGFSMKAEGTPYFRHAGSEWFDEAGREIPNETQGYHVHGERVVYQRVVKGATCLDMPDVVYVDGQAIYRRTYEWRNDVDGVVLKLPDPEEEFLEEKAGFNARVVRGVLRVRLKGKRHMVGYDIRCGDAEAYREGGKTFVKVAAARKGERWLVDAWVAGLGEKVDSRSAGITKISEYLRGGPPVFTRHLKLPGLLDVEPAAKGSGYALDEIPVPANNPYGMPMTTSGLAFDTEGAAYISTLVGDVWRVTGLEGDLADVRWKRYASGISVPLGVEVVDNTVFVAGHGGVTKLHDVNGDHEADFYERFTKGRLQLGGLGQENQNLERDAAGNFYVCGREGILRISPDGTKMETISTQVRNPLGLAVRKDGLALSDSSEGSPGNGTCSIHESNHPENEKSVAKLKRILYLPRGVDNSPGSRIFLDDPEFGPLGGGIIGTSFGAGRIYQILRNPNQGTPQAAVIPLPMETSSGALRIARNPKDGQLYIVGLDGWGDFAVEEGSLNRLRYTGTECLHPVGWRAYQNGIEVHFNTPLDGRDLREDQFFLQQWNYIDSRMTYGSPEYSVRKPEQLGHDHVKAVSVKLSDNGMKLFIEAPDLLPAMCTQVYGRLRARNGSALKLNLFATLNQLNGNHPAAPVYRGNKALNLIVPEKESNGDTYTTIINFFDKRAGRDVVKREVAPTVDYAAGEVDYAWINKHLIMKQCIMCHMPGMAHDFSTHEQLLKYVDLENPEKSFLLGMVSSESMPPSPLPSVAPSMRKALLDWIMNGARE